MHSFLTLNHIDFLGVSEIWLTSGMSDSIVSVPGYNLIRSDNHSGIKKHGIALFIKDSIKYERNVSIFFKFCTCVVVRFQNLCVHGIQAPIIF